MREHGSNCYKKRLLLHSHTVHRNIHDLSILVIDAI
nr:MAG TPA: hypothetical protein [Caudoviricetes sp.]